MRPDGIPISLAEAARQAGRSERTIQRWINLRLLTRYRTTGGQRVVMLADVKRVERDQRQRTGARKRRAVMLSERRVVS
jgi:DNA-binding transcriptional MerR regulator